MIAMEHQKEIPCASCQSWNGRQKNFPATPTSVRDYPSGCMNTLLYQAQQRKSKSSFQKPQPNM